MKNKNTSVADAVALDMATLMESDEYRAVFTKQAAKKVEKKVEKKEDKKAKHSHDENKKCPPFCPAYKKKKADDINDAIESLTKISEILDSYGLVKSAVSTLKGLEQLVSEAEEMCNDAGDADDYELGEDDEESVGELSEESEDEESEDEESEDEESDGGESGDEKLRELLSNLGLSDELDEEEDDEEDDEEEGEQELDEDFDDEYASLYSLPKAADYRSEIKKIAVKKSKARGEFIFPKTHPKVKDKKDHFPINTIGRGRNALARANQFSKAPEWYNGSLESFVSSVARAVKSKYKDIEVSKAAKKPGPG
jgi:hypothetical protein